ncbi:hypothetical protein ACIRU3_08825 [Streptomyces sp. NPDC101151]|uniref:hypothetical protein n=1 Tax=Streptomyces sp. NPDC101151 TaxID=3366115 RepID=UPI00381811AA
MGATEHGSTQMQLNHVPTDPSSTANPPGLPGGQKDLASSPAEKKAAAKAIEDHIEPETKKAGDWADEQTDAVVKEFGARDGGGWVASGAIKKAHKTWGDQVQALMNRLGSEKSALHSTNSLFQTTDFGVRTQVRASSSLDKF